MAACGVVSVAAIVPKLLAGGTGTIEGLLLYCADVARITMSTRSVIARPHQRRVDISRPVGSSIIVLYVEPIL